MSWWTFWERQGPSVAAIKTVKTKVTINTQTLECKYLKLSVLLSPQASDSSSLQSCCFSLTHSYPEFWKSCFYLCKYVTVIDFSISEPIKGRKGDSWHFKDNKHIWCNALWFSPMFLTHNWRNRWLDFLGSLKYKLNQYESAPLLNRVNPFCFFFLCFFFFQIETYQRKDLASHDDMRHVPERLLHKRRTCFVEPGAFYFFWHEDLWNKYAHISPYTVIGTHYANCISIITN